MAAHALTIARQLLNYPDDQIIAAALRSLDAPGWDTMPWHGDSKNVFHTLYMICKDSQEGKRVVPAEVRETVKECEQQAIYLEKYGLRNYESYKEALDKYVRFGKAFYRKRLKAFFEGTHGGALAAATPEAVQYVRDITRPREIAV